eukprot:TRINITY_DN1269_c0_g4_i1.p1 TRINITY_DN1269_c0_g4~~TRINITY_DN1269_c0_g4_i1.p1  ORF type:complete len:774 (-),score=78.00 TRINITY_DN1269_c0_g4_i1:368-2689(-)
MYVKKRDASAIYTTTTRNTINLDDLSDDSGDDGVEDLGHERNVGVNNFTDVDGPLNLRAEQLIIAQDPDCIDRDALKRVVAKQQSQIMRLLSLPFSLLFFCVFAFSVFMHEDITYVYVIESGLRMFLEPGLDEVESIPDVWNYLNKSLIPKLFDQKDLDGNPLESKSQWSEVLMYNQLHGPLVLEQVRSNREPCAPGDELLSDMTCFPLTTDSTEAYGLKSPSIAEPNSADYAFGNVTLADRKKYYDGSFIPASESLRRLTVVDQSYAEKVSGPRIFRAYIYPNAPYHLIQEQLNYLREKGWLDEQSKMLHIKGLLFNAEVGRPRLEQLSITMVFNRGGGVMSHLSLNAVFMLSYSGLLSMGVDVMYVGMLIIVTAQEIRRACRARRENMLLKHLGQQDTVLELIVVGGGWCCIACYALLGLMTLPVIARYEEVIDAQVRDVPADLNSLGQELSSAVDTMVYLKSSIGFIVAEYHLALMFRFFTAFAAQPRLGVVIGTLSKSLIDIFHFLIVLLPTFVAYAITGSLIYGRRLEEFSTFEKSIGTCFKMLLEGEFEWPQLSLEHFYTSLIWTWSFLLLLVLLMLNMVLAIIMDVYTDLRRSAGKLETVWATFGNLWQRVRNRKQWVGTALLAEHLEFMPTYITRDQFRKEFPDMPEVQLNMLVKACDQESEFGSGLGISDAMKLAYALRLSLEKVDDDLKGLFNDATNAKQINPHERYRPAQVGRGWAQELSERTAVHNHRLLSLHWQLQQTLWNWEAIQGMKAGTEIQSPKMP